MNRAYRELALHYGFLISPCLPRRPEHKGVVEGDIKYVKRNFLPLFREAEKERGRDTPDADELAEELERWNRESCDQHVVQKVGRTPLELFESEEAQALRPLPMTRWDPVVCKELSVGPDWRVQFDKAFYTVPYRLIGERVLVLGSSQVVRIFLDFQEVTAHPRAKQAWQVMRRPQHAPPELEDGQIPVPVRTRARLLRHRPRRTDSPGVGDTSMEELALLKPKLARLKLSGMLDTLSERLSQALAEQWSYTQFLDMLLTDEAERRDFKQLGRRLTKSGLAPDKTLETFDFSFNPRIHAPTLRELATCRFVERAENVFSSVHPASARATQLRRSGTSPVARDMRSPTSAPACCSTGSTPVAATAPTSAGCAGSAPSLFLSWTISGSPLCPSTSSRICMR